MDALIVCLWLHRERVVNSTSLEQTVQQLKPSTSYEFRLMAWNSDGPSQQAARTEILTRPEGLSHSFIICLGQHGPWKLHTNAQPSQRSGQIQLKNIHVKNVFLRFFYFGHVLTFFNVNYLPDVFLFLKNVGKVQSGKQINKKHFHSNSNEIQWVHK